MENMNKKIPVVVKNFYDDVSKKLNFVCEINNPRLSQTVLGIITGIHPDILKRNYGSAFIIPDKIKGCKIFDMGCGAGVMAFVLSKLVGKNGFITGVDISPNLIEQANKAIEYHQQKYDYDKPNVEFKVANVQELDDIMSYENKMDIVLSYGVICLCPNKKAVFQNIYRMLKNGGEFLMGDIYADRDRPIEILQNQRLVSLGTACSMKWDEMVDIVTSIGFTKPCLVGAAPVEFQDKDLHKETGFSEFMRAEWRLFKLPKGVRRSPAEVTYLGNIPDNEDSYRWDVNTVFPKGEPVMVGEDLATILAHSRFKDNFTFKDTSSDIQHTVTNPFQFIEELKKEGHVLKPAYRI